MGWLTMPLSSMGGHRSAKAYLDAQFCFERDHGDGTVHGLRILKSACVQNRVYYAAVQPYAKETGGSAEKCDPVSAVICLVKWNPRDAEGYVFGFKDMDEAMGPSEDDCPESILALLEPTTSEYALDWRRRCLARLTNRQRSLPDGAKIKLPDAMTFTDGYAGDEFTVKKRGRQIRLISPQGRAYRISRLMDRNWTLVPQTKIHAPAFGARASTEGPRP